MGGLLQRLAHPHQVLARVEPAQGRRALVELVAQDHDQVPGLTRDAFVRVRVEGHGGDWIQSLCLGSVAGEVRISRSVRAA